jgi:hypothetical protein
MNIPLDRLYHFINDTANNIYEDHVIIYRFWPHGSKNIQDLNMLYLVDWYRMAISPGIWCNDQEPLDYEFYKTQIRKAKNPSFSNILKSYNLWTAPKNLNYGKNMFEKGLLLHSEKRSNNLKKYQIDNELIPVYYWSHAVIARDWFRYAEHAIFQKNVKKTFLIYNRAWAGTREYRLRFSDLLVERKLVDQCQTSCNPVDPELNLHYANYKFNNPLWQPTHVLENFLQPTAADSSSSADFDTNNYNSTDIEVILETLFDDDRLHLTEKSLRPIACGQPFILTATQGSLEYLRSYGFQTFDTVWDESYDQITNPEERLIAVVDLMQQIVAWDPKTRANKMAQARSIADYNRRWFFSKDFFDLIITELKTNLKSAFDELEQCANYNFWIDKWQTLITYPEVNNFLNTNQNLNYPTKEFVKQAMTEAQNRLAEIANENKT